MRVKLIVESGLQGIFFLTLFHHALDIPTPQSSALPHVSGASSSKLVGRQQRPTGNIDIEEKNDDDDTLKPLGYVTRASPCIASEFLVALVILSKAIYKTVYKAQIHSCWGAGGSRAR